MKKYQIGEVVELTGHSSHSLRYYEKEGLLYDIARDEKGYRFYTERDIDLIKAIDCLKETGMSIQKIRSYIQVFQEGASSYDKRLAIFQLQREEIIKKQEKLAEELAMADYKIWYYQNISPEMEEDPLRCQKMKKLYEDFLGGK